jgi:probable rRNA maturation factor
LKVLVSDVTGGMPGGTKDKRRKTVKRSAKDTAKDTVAAAMRVLGLRDSEVSILLTDDDGIRGLNKKYRGIDSPTDVLSFSLDDSYMLGDIVVSLERVSVQAKDYCVSFDEELSRLLLHGLLHLLGYDHVTGGRQAKLMKDKEGELLHGLKEEGLLV